MESQKDIYYINRVRNGDPSAYAYLVDKHKTMAFNVALQLMGNREDAEEVAQDAFLKAYQNLNSFKGEAKFSTWIYRIIYNSAISRLRKKKIPVSSIDEEGGRVVNIKDTKLELQELKQEEQKQFLQQALENMEREDKLLLTLFYLDENSVDEVAKIMGLTPSNVKVKLYRARKKLYQKLRNLLQGEILEIL
ncbi:MAG: RNA polymerase sigma factor [Marinifilaceae bacterium]